ncbi:MAG TPA: PH domain-containing protein [Rhizomicrobium sp.]|nr:PH domain-containing protein [Rhizomicrobium sp.]
MSYIQRSLGDGERVVTYARFHPLYSLAAWLALILPLLLFLGALVETDSGTSPYVLGFALLALLGLVFFLKVMIRLWSTEIGVTSHRFVEKHGLLSMHTNEIALPNIEGIRVNQSMLGRMFGFGTVRIEGTGVDSVTTPAIADPVGFVRAIQTAKELMSRR